MRNYRFINYIQDKKAYWKAKRLFYNNANKNASRTNNVRLFLGEQRLQFRLLWFSFKGMPYLLITALIFVVGIEVLSALLGRSFGWELLVTKENEDTLAQLLTAFVTVLGVVLGLYFTALSAVAGNLFVQAPVRLQRLFLSDRKGRQYIQTLVLATLTGVLYLLYMSAGYQPSIIGPLGLVVICAYVVMRFITLGSQAFYFIHPAEASSKLQGDLRSTVNSVTFHYRTSKRALVQAQSQRKAAQALQTFDKLVDFGIKPVKLSGQQLFSIANYLGFSLEHYIINRGKIPTDRLWFTTKNVHQKWLLSDGNNLIIALNTGTGLRPNAVRHMEWFEETALRTIFKVLRHLISIKDWSSAQACVEVLVQLAERSGRYFAKTTTTLIVEKAIQEISEALAAINTKEMTDEDTEGILSLYEGIGRLPTAALIGMLKVVHELSAEQLMSQLGSIKWGRSGDFYKHELPTPMIVELEKIQYHLNNEKAIEGRTISPDWYLRTLCLYHYLSAAISYYEHIKTYNAIYQRQVTRLTKDKNYLAAACIASCSIEYANKLIELGQDSSRLIKEGEEFHGIKDLKWVIIDGDAEKAAVIKSYNDAVDRMINLIGYLFFIPKEAREGFPDYLGQAIVFGMQAIHEAARKNDPVRLKQIFVPVLMGALASRDYIQEDVVGWLPESQITLITEPLEDILSLSGFIKIYSELHGNPELWRVCEAAWNGWLKKDDVDAVKLIRMLAATMTYRDSIFAITPRANLRIGWDMRLREALEEAGVSTGMTPGLFDENDKPAHDSPLIRLVARGAGMLNSDARTIFLSLYLSKVEAVKGLEIDFPDRRDFERMYDNEIKRYGDPEVEDGQA